MAFVNKPVFLPVGHDTDMAEMKCPVSITIRRSSKGRRASVMTSPIKSESEQTLKNWSFRLISRLEACVSQPEEENPCSRRCRADDGN